MSTVVEISILIVAISILVVSLLGSISFILLSKNISEFLKKKNKIDELNLYDQVYNSRESIEMMLDEFIGKQFDEYKIFNPDIFQSEYLSSNDLEKIVTELRRKVLSNISISLLNELSLIFNKEQLYTIITTKIRKAFWSFMRAKGLLPCSSLDPIRISLRTWQSAYRTDPMQSSI